MNTNNKKEIGKNLFVCIRVHSWLNWFLPSPLEHDLPPQDDAAAAADSGIDVQEIAAQDVSEGRARYQAVVRVIEGVEEVSANLEVATILAEEREILHHVQIPILLTR